MSLQPKLSSVRFHPHWFPGDTSQVLGLVSMIATILHENPSAVRWLELGSYAGEAAELILAHPQITTLHCVDQWGEAVEATRLRTRSDPRARVFHASTAEFAKIVTSPYDVVYIDADHSYEGVKADIEAYAKLVSSGGYLCGHDHHEGFPGVIRAVREFCDCRLRLRTFRDTSWMVRCE